MLLAYRHSRASLQGHLEQRTAMTVPILPDSIHTENLFYPPIAPAPGIHEQLCDLQMRGHIVNHVRIVKFSFIYVHKYLKIYRSDIQRDKGIARTQRVIDSKSPSTVARPGAGGLAVSSLRIAH
jgi:hypothetical protein